MKSQALLIAFVALVSTMAFAGIATATSITSTTGGGATTPSIHAVNSSGHVTLANPIANISCSSTVQANVESHGFEAPASGKVVKLELTGCTNSWHVTTLNTGGLWIYWAGGHNGTLMSSGAKVDTTRLGVTCIYETNNTSMGTITGGNPATLSVSASIPINTTESSPLCGTGNAKWQGQYSTTSALYVAWAAVCCGGGESGSMATTPSEVTKNVGETFEITVENLTSSTIKTEGDGVPGAELVSSCKEKHLFGYETCKAKIKCLFAGEYEYVVYFPGPFGFDNTKIKCQ